MRLLLDANCRAILAAKLRRRGRLARRMPGSDFWIFGDTLAQCDSLFQNSLLLSHLLSRNAWKARRIRARGVPRGANSRRMGPVPKNSVPKFSSTIEFRRRTKESGVRGRETGVELRTCFRHQLPITIGHHRMYVPLSSIPRPTSTTSLGHAADWVVSRFKPRGWGEENSESLVDRVLAPIAADGIVRPRRARNWPRKGTRRHEDLEPPRTPSECEVAGVKGGAGCWIDSPHFAFRPLLCMADGRRLGPFTGW